MPASRSEARSGNPARRARADRPAEPLDIEPDDIYGSPEDDLDDTPAPRGQRVAFTVDTLDSEGEAGPSHPTISFDLNGRVVDLLHPDDVEWRKIARWEEDPAGFVDSLIAYAEDVQYFNDAVRTTAHLNSVITSYFSAAGIRAPGNSRPSRRASRG